MNLGRRNRIKAEGGMSSMTDLVFLMLIFFIIMSTMSQPGLPIDVPSGTGETGEKSQVNVGVTPDNMYILGEDLERKYTYEEVEPLVISKMEAQVGDNTIKISGDREADYEYVFKLIALSKKKEWKPILVFQ